jgi:hypothetical protein
VAAVVCLRHPLADDPAFQRLASAFMARMRRKA